MKRTLLSLALLAVLSPAMAQAPPTSGSQLRQIPPAPVPPVLAPAIRIEPQRAAPAPAGAETVRILVRTLRVSGATLFPESELVAVAGFRPGTEHALTDLQAMAARITAFYRARGYFVAQAYLPAQDVNGGEVTIAVAEGRYGAVRLRNESAIGERVLRAPLAGLEAGDVIASAPLESRLLALSDLPGVVVRSTLVPGASVGTSDLIVDVLPGQRVSGSVDADNAGNRYTGEYRLGATVNLNNPMGLGDVLSLRVLTSGSGLAYARISYQMQVGPAQVGVAYSHLHYSLGREFASLDASGTARIASVYGRLPLVRSTNDNVYAQLAFDAKAFDDRTGVPPASTEKTARVVMASIVGDHRDTIGGVGLSTYAVTLSSGDIDVRTAAARSTDAAGPRTQGRFGKLAFNAARLQTLGGPFTGYAALSGQFASKNLDVSEKMELGGMNAVRAYPEGESYADEGLLLTLEGRMALGQPAWLGVGQLQAVAFVDAGSVRFDHAPWTARDNRRTLSGAGLGLHWADPGNFAVRTYYAWKLGHQRAVSAPDRSGRFWIQAVKFF